MTEEAGIRSKFGHLVSGDDVDFTYPNVWAQEVTTGPDRLVIAPSGQYIDLLIEMLSVMEGPDSCTSSSFLGERKQLAVTNLRNR